MKTDFDELFIGATEEYLPDWYDWRLLKSQGFKESSFDPLAVSPANAKGMMQFLQPTWDDGWGKGDIFDPADSINAGARYMRWLIGQWVWERPQMDRIALALASYNAGLGNILKAQKRANNSAMYAPVIRQLDQVTGRHAHETTEYVRQILWFWMREVCNS